MGKEKARLIGEIMKRWVLGIVGAMVVGGVVVAQQVAFLRTLSGHTGSVNSVAFSPDGRPPLLGMGR